MNKVLLSYLLVGAVIILGTSCKRNNYCYTCATIGTASWNAGQKVSKQECDLSKKERDAKANEFEWTYYIEDWNTTCSRTSN